METKAGRNLIASMELDIPKLQDAVVYLRKLAAGFMEEAQKLEESIGVLKTRVAILREEQEPQIPPPYVPKTEGLGITREEEEAFKRAQEAQINREMEEAKVQTSTEGRGVQRREPTQEEKGKKPEDIKKNG